MNAKKPTDWPLAIHKVLAGNGIRQVSYVPDAGHKRLIELCQADKAMRTVVLTTEEEGLGLVMGAWLAGDKSAVLMQSSGVGNIINTLATIKECRFPLLMLVTMRGDHGEFNPSQVAMGNATQDVLEAMGVIVRRADAAGEVAEQVSGALRMAYNTYRPMAVLIGQKVMGAKDFRKLTKTQSE